MPHFQIKCDTNHKTRAFFQHLVKEKKYNAERILYVVFNWWKYEDEFNEYINKELSNGNNKN